MIIIYFKQEDYDYGIDLNSNRLSDQHLKRPV